MDEFIIKEIMPRLGEAVGTLRNNRNINQTQLANKAELSRATLENIEQGKRLPQMVNFFKLCIALDLSPDELMKYALPDWEMYKKTYKSLQQKALSGDRNSQSPQDTQEEKYFKPIGLAGGYKSAKIKLRFIKLQFHLYYAKAVMNV